MLSARSEVFERMLYGPMKEGAAHVDIDVPDLDETCFMNLLRFVYTAKAELTPETAMGTLYAAKKYGVQGLRSSCVKYLQQLLNVRNACMMYSQALLFDEIELQVCPPPSGANTHTAQSTHTHRAHQLSAHTLGTKH